MTKTQKYVIVKVEPSKELSKMMGFPYLIERRFPLRELVENGIVNEEDVRLMELGETIPKSIPVNITKVRK